MTWHWLKNPDFTQPVITCSTNSRELLSHTNLTFIKVVITGRHRGAQPPQLPDLWNTISSLNRTSASTNLVILKDMLREIVENSDEFLDMSKKKRNTFYSQAQTLLKKIKSMSFSSEKHWLKMKKKYQVHSFQGHQSSISMENVARVLIIFIM